MPGIILQLQLHADGRRTLPYASDGLLSLTGLDPEKLRQDASPLFQSIASQDQASTESSLADAAIQIGKQAPQAAAAAAAAAAPARKWRRRGSGWRSIWSADCRAGVEVIAWPASGN